MMVQDILIQLEEEFGMGKKEVMKELNLKDRQTYDKWYGGVKPTSKNRFKLIRFLERCQENHSKLLEIGSRILPTKQEVIIAGNAGFGDWGEWLKDGRFRNRFHRVIRQAYDVQVNGAWRWLGKYDTDYEDWWIWDEEHGYEWQIKMVALYHPDPVLRARFQSLI